MNLTKETNKNYSSYCERIIDRNYVGINVGYLDDELVAGKYNGAYDVVGIDYDYVYEYNNTYSSDEISMSSWANRISNDIKFEEYLKAFARAKENSANN